MEFWMIVITTLVAVLTVAFLGVKLRPREHQSSAIEAKARTTELPEQKESKQNRVQATGNAPSIRTEKEEKKEPQKKDSQDRKDTKKEKQKEPEEPPEVIAARQKMEQMCSGCPFPCDEHPWLPASLQDKIKWTPLKGTVKTYKKHLLLCSGVSSALWPADVEEDPTSFPALLGRAIKARKADIGYTVKLTVCDLRSEGHHHEGIDIIVFPSMIKLLHVTVEKIPDVIQKLLVENLHPKDAGIPHHPTDFTSCIMVCAHKLRDKRCGVAGPLLAKEFNRQCHDRGLHDVAIVEVSHTGGHKYAGNVIVYPSGHWYGRVTTCSAKALLDLHFADSTSEAAFSDFPLSRGASGCVKDLTDW
jgi:(2Fe-2S) ferredoxin